MKSSWIIIPVHNRRSFTLNCLSNLESIGVMENFSIVVVDDGSSDGTEDAIRNAFSSSIVLRGNGNLYWTGAIETGMRYAIEHGAECFVWLNDDSVVQAGAIERLVQIANETGGIASAQTYVDMHTIGLKYYFPGKYKGKWSIINKELPLNDVIVPVDACRGNLVAISKKVVEKIGYPDGKNIPHVLGDADYTLRATRAGLPCTIITDVLLEEIDSIKVDINSWLLGETKISTLWARIFSKRSAHYPSMKWVFLKRHWGWRGMLQYPIPYVKLALISLFRILIPRRILISIYGRHSHAWKTTEWCRSIVIKK